MAGKKGRSGRPVTFKRATADKILAELRTGRTLRAVCRDEGMPPESTVREWVGDNRDGFAAHYEDARLAGYFAMADELLDIADDGTNDYTTRTSQNGEEYDAVNPEVVSRSRLRVDTRKWLLSKALPKVFGDKLDVNANVRSTILVRDRFDDEGEE